MKRLSCQNVEEVQGGFYAIPCGVAGAGLAMAIYLSFKGSASNPVNSTEMVYVSVVSGSIVAITAYLFE